MKYFIYLVILIFGIFLIGIGFFAYNFLPAEKYENKDFVIQVGDGVHQISQNLYQQGLIKNKFVFETYVWYKGLEKQFIAGSFTIPAGSNNFELVKILTSPQSANKLVLKFIEGWTTVDIANYLLEQKVINSTAEFNEYNKVGLWQDKYSFLAELSSTTTLEGYLFPDTYHFFSNPSVVDIIDKMLKNFDNKFNESMRLAASEQGRSISDIVKLASLLEKEVKTEKDMRLVADIFLRRLSLGMLLQADSTLNYAIGGKNPSLTAEELALDNPYNSYKYPGLPPTPIANPGLIALQAALYPQANDFLFFLTAPDGQVYYAKTFVEHTKNRQYLR